MAAVRRLLLTAKRTWRAAITGSTFAKTLNPCSAPIATSRTRFFLPLRDHGHPNHENVRSIVPAIVCSILGVGMLDIGCADADESSAKAPQSSESSPTYVDLEETAKKERRRLEESLRSKGLHYGAYPRFTVAVKGQRIAIKFQIPATCDTQQLIANLTSNLGRKVDERGGFEMAVRVWSSKIAWQMTLSQPKAQNECVENKDPQADTTPDEKELFVTIFRSLITADRPEIEFMKQGSLSPSELEALVSALQLAGAKPGQSKNAGNSAASPSKNKSVTSLEAMGVRVFGLEETQEGQKTTDISWDAIAGYDQQKREIEDTILLALHSPEVYDDIARGTRRKYESNRPRAVLFEGPPGTGKTSCARVIACQAGVPLLYVPLEVVMSKYYGESERLFGKVFSLANELPDGAIIFLDEVDAFAVSRSSEIHEASRRVLSVLLRQIDGFEQDKKVVVIAATNRKQDLDPALISRFDAMITFGLPDLQNREEIAAQYAKHLTKSELTELALASEGMSGRDIRDICQQAERRWASKLIRGQASGGESDDAKEGSLPPLQEYIDSAADRRKALLAVDELKNRDPSFSRDRRPLAFS